MSIQKPIDPDFDFRSDTPVGKDPDAKSPTLRNYHKILWSKKLPNGEMFELTDTKSGKYLYHNSKLGEFSLSSDGIVHSYNITKKMLHIINKIQTDIIDSFEEKSYTIGGFIIFPSNRINMQMTINGARGCYSQISDRFDLTLECIRLFYQNVDNPLTEVFKRYSDFFNLFDNFEGYVNFFQLQDLVTPDYKEVKFFLEHNSFENKALPQNVDEYLEYKDKAWKFIDLRAKRMMKSLEQV